MSRLLEWLSPRWRLLLRLVAAAAVLGALTQLVLLAPEFSHNRRFLHLLGERAPEFWLLVLVWSAALGLRWWRSPRDSEALLARPWPHGGVVALLLLALISPFMNAYFSHLTHPVLAAAVAWTVWPAVLWLGAHLRRGAARIPAAGVPWILAGMATLIFFTQSYRRHLWFGSGGKDLGLFHQSVWLLSRFETPNNTVMGMHAFADHLEFIDILAAPLQWLWPSAGSLLLFQALVVGSGVVPIYALAQRRLGGSVSAFGMVVVYVFCFDVQSAVMFDWNPTTCGAGIIPWVVWLYERERPVGFAVALALLALAKENLVLYALGICLALAFRPRRRLALASAGLLALWFVVEMKVLFPLFRPEGFRHMRFEDLGGSASEMLGTALQSPYRAFALLFTPGGKINGLLLPFSSVAFASLLAPRWALAVAPAVFERFWSSHSNRWWGHHYGAGVGVIAVVAAIDGLGRLKSWLSSRSADHLFGIVVLTVVLSALAMSTLGRFGPGPLWLWRHTYYATEKDRADAALALQAIPPDASVAAQNHLLPHLSARRQIFEAKRPISAEYVALDLVQSAWPFKREYANTLARELLGTGYGVVACHGAAVILRQGAASIDCPAVGTVATPTQ